MAAHRRPSSFEPYHAVVARALDAIADITQVAASSPGATALVVSHSGLIRSIVRSLGGHDTRVPNLGGVWLRAVPGRETTLRADGLFAPRSAAVSGIEGPGEDPREFPAGSRR